MGCNLQVHVCSARQSQLLSLPVLVQGTRAQYNSAESLDLGYGLCRIQKYKINTNMHKSEGLKRTQLIQINIGYLPVEGVVLYDKLQ